MLMLGITGLFRRLSLIGLIFFAVPNLVGAHQISVSDPAEKRVDAPLAVQKEITLARLNPKQAQSQNITKSLPLLRITEVILEPGEGALFSGTGKPHTYISIVAGDDVIARTKVWDTGQWEAVTAYSLDVGDHELTAVAEIDSSGHAQQSKTIVATMPEDFDGVAVLAYYGSEETSEEAEIAIANDYTPLVLNQRFAQNTDAQTANDATAGQEGDSGSVETSSPFEPVRNWLQESAEDYQNIVIHELSTPRTGGTVPEAVDEKTTTQDEEESIQGDKAADSSTLYPAQRAFPYSVWDSVTEWLAKSNRDYQGKIVRKLEIEKTGGSGAAGDREATVSESAEPSSVPVPQAKSDVVTEQSTQDLTDDIARMAREAEEAAQAAIQEAELRRKAEAEAERKRQVAIAEAEAARKAAERRQQEEDRQRQAEQRARTAAIAAERERSALKRAEEEAKAAEAKRAAEAEALRQAEAERQAAAERKRLAEKRLAEERAIAAAEKAEQEEVRRLAALQAEERRLEVEEEARLASRRAADDDLNWQGRKNTKKTYAYRPARKSKSSSAKRGTSKKVKKVKAWRSQKKRYKRKARRKTAVAGYVSRRPRSKVRSKSRKYYGKRSCRYRAGRRVKPLPGRYTVKRGDTLWSIARRHYRKGKRYYRIVRANRRKLRNPNLIYPCQRLYLPRR